MTNNDLFQLYDSDLVLRLRNVKNLSDTRKMLTRFKQYLNEFPPSPDLAKGFLAQYSDRKPRTLYRYAQMIRVFMKWYGEPLDDFKMKIPRTLPPYTEDNEIESLFSAIENKRSHKYSIVRDSLLVSLALKTGMRRSELGNLEVKDIHPDLLIVRNGKGGKDRSIPLAPAIAKRLQNFIEGKQPAENVFGLKPACISNKIRRFARKAGLDGFHTHTMRHKFASDLLEKGANVKQVQELLGHDNLATTEVYLSVTDQGKCDAINLLDEERSDSESQNTIKAIRKRQAII
ncbi:tyrosine-type recombinase/integrase [Chloroflexota bacterium]